MKKLVLALLLLITASAHAQVVSITNYVAAQMPNNTSNTITPARARNAVNAFLLNFSTVPYGGEVVTSYPVTTTSYVSALTYYGDGSNLTGISATVGSVAWEDITGVPSPIQLLSDSTSVSVTTLNSQYASFTTAYLGACTGPGCATTPDWYDITNIPVQVIAVSDSTDITMNKVSSTYVYGNQISGTTLYGTVGTATQNSIATMTGLTNVSVTGNISVTTINGQVPSFGGSSDRITSGTVALYAVSDSGLLSATAPIKFVEQDSQSYEQGLLYYSSHNQALEFFNDEPDVELQIGQENWIRVYNESGATILNGSVVYATGAETGDGRLTIGLAKADAANTSKVLGFATHDIENNSYGFVTQFGYVNAISTTAYTEGEPIYLDYSVAGGITSTVPLSPNFEVFLGYISNIGTTSGSLFITALGNTSGNSVAGDATQLVVASRKSTAGTITKGSPVYVAGYNTGLGVALVEGADNDNASAMPAIGIAADTFTNAATGNVVISGRIAALDTSAYAVNDQLFVSSTAGALTNVRPNATNTAIQKVGVVLRSHATQGVIQVIGAGRVNDTPNIVTATSIYGVTVTGTTTSFTTTSATYLYGRQISGTQAAIGTGTFTTASGTFVYGNQASFTTINIGACTGAGCGGSSSWYGLTNIPVPVQSVSNSGAIILNSLGVTNAVTATTISGTFVYGNQISGTTIAGLLTTANQSNITNVGVLSSLGVTNAITATTVSITNLSATLITNAQVDHCWITYDISGGTCSVISSYNATCTYLSTGTVRVTCSTAMRNANYKWSCTTQRGSGGDLNGCVRSNQEAPTTTTGVFVTYIPDTQTRTNDTTATTVTIGR